jgi:hypothetical protein
LQEWRDYDPYERYLTADELCQQSGLTPEIYPGWRLPGSYYLIPMMGDMFSALAARSGYRRIRIAGNTFDGSPEALAAMESGVPARLIEVESLGSE